VIVGGESGPHARPMHPDWAIHLASECEEHGTPFFFKQWGEFVPADGTAKNEYGTPYGGYDDPNGKTPIALPDGTITDLNWNGGPGPHLIDGHQLLRLGKKRAGRELLGRTWDQFPQAVAP
jgi:protein gp37